MHCPFCKNRINLYDGKHIYSCNKNTKILDKIKIKYEFLSFNFHDISKKNILFNEYVIGLKSLPDIRRDYRISYKNILFLLDYHNIKKRSMKVSSKQISTIKYKKTCLSKYGVDNISKIKSNKKINIIDKSEINNNIKNFLNLRDIFLSKNFNFNYTNIDQNAKKDFKIIYKNCYNHWMNLTDEQKDFLIDKNQSKIETKITNCLDILNIGYIKRFMIRKRFFDIKIKKNLIDINGDFWHANPSIYKENDTLKFPFKSVKAKTIWNRDLSKKKLAETRGYKVYYIWENDIKNMSDDDIINYLMNNIFNI